MRVSVGSRGSLGEVSLKEGAGILEFSQVKKTSLSSTMTLPQTQGEALCLLLTPAFTCAKGHTIDVRNPHACEHGLLRQAREMAYMNNLAYRD